MHARLLSRLNNQRWHDGVSLSLQGASSYTGELLTTCFDTRLHSQREKNNMFSFVTDRQLCFSQTGTADFERSLNSTIVVVVGCDWGGERSDSLSAHSLSAHLAESTLSSGLLWAGEFIVQHMFGFISSISSTALYRNRRCNKYCHMNCHFSLLFLLLFSSFINQLRTKLLMLHLSILSRKRNKAKPEEDGTLHLHWSPSFPLIVTAGYLNFVYTCSWFVVKMEGSCAVVGGGMKRCVFAPAPSDLS